MPSGACWSGGGPGYLPVVVCGINAAGGNPEAAGGDYTSRPARGDPAVLPEEVERCVLNRSKYSILLIFLLVIIISTKIEKVFKGGLKVI